MIPENVLNSFKGKRILITGGTGLIGRQITDILCQAGAKVRTMSLDTFGINSLVQHYCGDLTNPTVCQNVVQKMEYVFHLAGIKGSVEATKTKPADFLTPMLLLNTNILRACQLNNIEKVIYTSSIGAYSSAEVLREEDRWKGEPMDKYPGWAKRMGELQIQAYIEQHDLNNFSIVRLSNVYGPGDSFTPDSMVIPALMHRIYHKENPLVVWGDGSAIRDFAYSEDIAQGIILALYHSAPFLNLGSGIGYSIRELVETLHSFIDFDYKFDPTKPSGYPKRVMDISLAKGTIGYNPTTSLREGLEKTWRWYIESRL